MLAEGRFNYAQVAEKAGVDLRTLHRWRRHPPFKARVAEFRAQISEAGMSRALIRKDYRVNVLADVHSKLLQVIEERAADPSMAKVRS